MSLLISTVLVVLLFVAQGGSCYPVISSLYPTTSSNAGGASSFAPSAAYTINRPFIPVRSTIRDDGGMMRPRLVRTLASHASQHSPARIQRPAIHDIHSLDEDDYVDIKALESGDWNGETAQSSMRGRCFKMGLEDTNPYAEDGGRNVYDSWTGRMGTRSALDSCESEDEEYEQFVQAALEQEQKDGKAQEETAPSSPPPAKKRENRDSEVITSVPSPYSSPDADRDGGDAKPDPRYRYDLAGIRRTRSQ